MICFFKLKHKTDTSFMLKHFLFKLTGADDETLVSLAHHTQNNNSLYTTTVIKLSLLKAASNEC